MMTLNVAVRREIWGVRTYSLLGGHFQEIDIAALLKGHAMW